MKIDHVGFSWKNCPPFFLATNVFSNFPKKSRNFFTVNCIEKNFEIFSENLKKKFVAKTNKGTQGLAGGIRGNFFQANLT